MTVKKTIRNLALSALIVFLIAGCTSFAGARAHMNQLQLAMRGETSAQANKYDYSFSEGIEKNLTTLSDDEIAEMIPAAQRKADENVTYNVFRERIPSYSMSDIKHLDMTKMSGITADDIKAAGTYSGLKGLEDDFVQAEKKYKVNCLFLYAIAVTESGGGTAMFKPNNMFGYGQKSFSSKAECIDFVAGKISEDYLTETGPYYHGKTAEDVNKAYCVHDSWHGTVEKTMYEMYKAARIHNLAQYSY
ncbi:MAG: hypothetical protein ACOX4I_03605 [Anaerovoracaceae bacterium]|jgi:methionine-rich copper-binding protein CopC